MIFFLLAIFDVAGKGKSFKVEELLWLSFVGDSREEN